MMMRERVVTEATVDQKRADDPGSLGVFLPWTRPRASAKEALVLNTRQRTEKHTALISACWARRFVKLLALWVLLEFPVEYLSSEGNMERIALTLSTALWLSLTVIVLKGSAVAQGMFLFLCALGILAISPMLPLEYMIFRVGFYFSLVESVLKSLVLMAFAWHNFFKED